MNPPRNAPNRVFVFRGELHILPSFLIPLLPPEVNSPAATP
jgi:hypothetical protein